MNRFLLALGILVVIIVVDGLVSSIGLAPISPVILTILILRYRDYTGRFGDYESNFGEYWFWEEPKGK